MSLPETRNVCSTACSLAPDAYAERVAMIAALNADLLRSHSVSRRALELTYAHAAIPRVRELVVREEECCPFLEFTVEEDAAGVLLRIVVPDMWLGEVPAALAPLMPVGARTADAVSDGRGAQTSEQSQAHDVSDVQTESRPLRV